MRLPYAKKEEERVDCDQGGQGFGHRGFGQGFGHARNARHET